MLGHPIWSSSNLSANGSDVKVLAFGDFSPFVIREVRGLRLECSNDVFFAKNQVAVRGVSRIDSALTDVIAINYLHQAVT
jgi:HK97 family phage major capsid protein